MSIYATWLSLDGDEHEPTCTRMIPDGDIAGVFRIDDTKPCTCRARLDQPIVYQGSHVSPSDEDARGGFVMVCAIPDHCHPDVGAVMQQAWERAKAEGWAYERPEDMIASPRLRAELDAAQKHAKPVEFLRLSVREDPSTYGHNEEPGDATVVLTRRHVVELRDTLTAWLDAKARA